MRSRMNREPQIHNVFVLIAHYQAHYTHKHTYTAERIH